MKRALLCIALFAGYVNTCMAQADVVTPTVKKEKKFDQVVGAQLNGLINEVFNFSNNNSTTPVNPYLLVYSLNSRKSGWGLRLGLGYNYTSSSSDDGITANSTKLNDLAVRLGVDKAFMLSDKWSAGIGIDG